MPPPLGTWTLYTLHALPQDYRLHVTWRCPHPRDYRHSIYMYVTWRFYASTLLHVCRLCLGHGTGALKNKLNTIYKIVLESDQKNMLIGGNESTDTKSLNQCNEWIQPVNYSASGFWYPTSHEYTAGRNYNYFFQRPLKFNYMQLMHENQNFIPKH